MTNKGIEKEARYNIVMAQKSFLWSLGIGTLLEIAFIITDWGGLLAFGFLYIVVAVLFNLIVFINNIVFVIVHI